MRFSLLNTLWYSEKRKNILFLLKEGPRNIDQMKVSLNDSSRSLMPQIKQLIQKKLVIQVDNYYCLSKLGIIVTDSMEPLLNIMRVIEENKNFWMTRNLDIIPVDLFNRIGELGHYLLLEPDINRMFELPKEFTNNMLKSEIIFTCISYVHPQIPSFYLQILKEQIPFSLYLTDNALEKFNCEYDEELKQISSSNNIKIYLMQEEMQIPTIVVTECFLYISFLNNENRYDHRDIISFDRNAIIWGKDLISYYDCNSNLLI